MHRPRGRASPQGVAEGANRREGSPLNLSGKRDRAVGFLLESVGLCGRLPASANVVVRINNAAATEGASGPDIDSWFRESLRLMTEDAGENGSLLGRIQSASSIVIIVQNWNINPKEISHESES